MSRLPPALAPWAEPLAPFARDLALALGDWARRIAPAIGPMAGVQAGRGEPDGVSGLSRRGHYERLLLTEWLLAEELPLEFTRRAAAGEHLFLQRAHREKAAGRRSIAIFDAGPEQLGAPRIAQLAVLVVLSARAESAGIAFDWGIAQDSAGGLASGFSADRARRFLECRTDQPATPSLLDAWIKALPELTGGDELWLVGGSGLVRWDGWPGASRLLIDDVPDPAVRQVRLSLGTRAAGRRELSLDLPPRDDCKRLLRDPFRSARPEPSRLPGRVLPEAGIVFAPTGRRLAVRVSGANLLDVHVPNSPRQKPGKVRQVAGGPGLVGIGWDRRMRPVTAHVGAGSIRLEGRGRREGITVFGATQPAAARPDERVGFCAVDLSSGRTFVLDAAGTLVVVESGGEAASIVASGVGALQAIGQRIRYVACHEKGGVLVEQTRSEWERHTLGAGTGRVFLSSPFRRLVVATENAHLGLWTIRGERGDLSRPAVAVLEAGRDLRAPSGTEVVGVTTSPRGDPALLVLEADRRRFAFLDRTGFDLAFEAMGEVATVAVSPSERSVAYLTRRGALVVHSLDHGAPLLHAWGGGEC